MLSFHNLLIYYNFSILVHMQKRRSFSPLWQRRGNNWNLQNREQLLRLVYDWHLYHWYWNRQSEGLFIKLLASKGGVTHLLSHVVIVQGDRDRLRLARDGGNRRQISIQRRLLNRQYRGILALTNAISDTESHWVVLLDWLNTYHGLSSFAVIP